MKINPTIKYVIYQVLNCTYLTGLFLLLSFNMFLTMYTGTSIGVRSHSL